MGDTIRTLEGIEANILQAFRRDSQNVPHLDEDWINRTIKAAAADGSCSISMRLTDFRGVPVAPNVTISECATTDEMSLLKLLGDVNASYAIGDLSYLDWIAQNYTKAPRVAQVEVVEVSGVWYVGSGAIQDRYADFGSATSISSQIDSNNLASYPTISLGDQWGISGIAPSEPAGMSELGSWTTVRAAANLTSSTSSSADIITVPPGQAYKLSVEYTPASATSASDTVTLYPCGSAGTAAANSSASLTSAHAATTAIVLSPFSQLPEGVWAVIVTAGVVNMNSLTIKKQRVK